MRVQVKSSRFTEEQIIVTLKEHHTELWAIICATNMVSAMPILQGSVAKFSQVRIGPLSASLCS